MYKLTHSSLNNVFLLRKLEIKYNNIKKKRKKERKKEKYKFYIYIFTVEKF